MLGAHKLKNQFHPIWAREIPRISISMVSTTYFMYVDKSIGHVCLCDIHEKKNLFSIFLKCGWTLIKKFYVRIHIWVSLQMNAYIYIWERSLTQTHVRPFAHSQSLPLRVKLKQHKKHFERTVCKQKHNTHTSAHKHPCIQWQRYEEWETNMPSVQRERVRFWSV